MDKRALRILLDAFWSPSGWRPENKRGASPDDFAYAKSMGLMFDPVKLSHDQVVTDLSVIVLELDKRRVADAFLASLSTRRLDWRSALGSYAVFQHMPRHSPSAGGHCDMCGLYLEEADEDLNVLNFERFKWGGVRHDKPYYGRFDLKLFVENEAPIPTAEDLQIFRKIMAAISAVEADVTSASLHSHFSKVIASNKAERDVITAILGYCGVLETPERPGFGDIFIPVAERRIPDRRFVDMPYPACWWNGSVGVNQTKLNEWFGHVF